MQSRSNAKMLINRCFNMDKYIVTICGANMNPRVSQCKNCWRYGHSTFSCHIQGAKCVWCNGSHKLEHHCQFTWCYKANAKMNPLWLETKQIELCPHSFKCSNCWGYHQADSNICLFWRYWFNYDWYSQKQQELHENRSKSICSVMSSSSLWSMTT